MPECLIRSILYNSHIVHSQSISSPWERWFSPPYSMQANCASLWAPLLPWRRGASSAPMWLTLQEVLVDSPDWCLLSSIQVAWRSKIPSLSRGGGRGLSVKLPSQVGCSDIIIGNYNIAFLPVSLIRSYKLSPQVTENICKQVALCVRCYYRQSNVV